IKEWPTHHGINKPPNGFGSYAICMLVIYLQTCSFFPPLKEILSSDIISKIKDNPTHGKLDLAARVDHHKTRLESTFASSLHSSSYLDPNYLFFGFVIKVAANCKWLEKEMNEDVESRLWDPIELKKNMTAGIDEKCLKNISLKFRSTCDSVKTEETKLIRPQLGRVERVRSNYMKNEELYAKELRTLLFVRANFAGDTRTAEDVVTCNMYGYFKSDRGLRQGEPMSSYLFTLVMEVLTLIVQRRVNRSNQFKFHWGCKELKLAQLCFADDQLMLCNGDHKSVEVLKEGLMEFSKASGLVRNMSKSTIFFGSVKDIEKKGFLKSCLFLFVSFP
ncbi:RNA-directed DNA polymerase, eukaryota, reverse transcriptase zinc-binding domain protein, partial [Tanacetum coccineum]